MTATGEKDNYFEMKLTLSHSSSLGHRYQCQALLAQCSILKYFPIIFEAISK